MIYAVLRLLSISIMNFRFNGVFSRYNFPEIKGGPYVINLDSIKSNGTHWFSLCIDKNIAFTLILLELKKNGNI